MRDRGSRCEEGWVGAMEGGRDASSEETKE